MAKQMTPTTGDRMIPQTIQTWQMSEPGKLTRMEIATPTLRDGEALVEISIVYIEKFHGKVPPVTDT